MKTRGTARNPANRFQPIATDRAFDDGWYQDPEDELCPDSVATEVMRETVTSIISRNQSPDVPFDQSINPYRGCEHVMSGGESVPQTPELGFFPFSPKLF